MPMPMLCVSAKQMMGWCDYKVARVVWGVAAGNDASLHGELVRATLEGGLFKNFIPLPFTEQSSYGRRLTHAWERVKGAYPESEIVQTFVWRFWRPLQDSTHAHLMHNAIGEAWMLPVDAKARAFAAAGIEFH